MSNVEFQVVYDGPALRNSEMNARELSASLAALDDLFESANGLLNGGKTKQTLKVQGSFETGSFKINLTSKMSAVDAAKELLISSEATAVLAAWGLVHIVVFSGSSLIKLIKWLRGNAPTKIIENDDGSFQVYQDKSSMRIEKEVLKLYEDFKTRKALEKVVKTPLEEGVIEEIAFNQHGSSEFETISIDEAEYFSAPEIEKTQVNVMEYTTFISLIKISFKEGNKWSVFDGANTINVMVEDDKFLKGVDESSILFGKGDRLKVSMRVEQSEVGKTLKTEYFIQDVIEHSHPEFKGQTSLLED